MLVTMEFVALIAILPSGGAFCESLKQLYIVASLWISPREARSSFSRVSPDTNPVIHFTSPTWRIHFEFGM